MKVIYNKKTDEVTIKLSWLETRQFLSNCGIKLIQATIREITNLPPYQKSKVANHTAMGTKAQGSRLVKRRQ